MSERILKPYTIIPPHLYVHRAADYQLKSVLSEMERPGYVLVARQMGKTNLLLNAKRELITDSDSFVYADLSNAFPDIRGYFRNIIDIAVAEGGPNPDLLQAIAKSREKSQLLPPHIEHEQELRILLRYIPGRLIICLDEIDALTKAAFSDDVFALIRSTYFSGRVNFPEFSRLTFVLSGVAEPTELIKNKSNSPFNIGVKIYLDDFTKKEFLRFIELSQLRSTTEVSDRVFEWAGGNPRMSWDICAALEEAALRNEIASPILVDRIVKKLYLTTYDVAPIDHIRKLVEEDRDVRAGVIALHYGKAASIPDQMKTRLYLHGIVRADNGDATVAMKNKIIEQALNENWLKDVEARLVPVLERANDAYDKRMYAEAIDLFDEYLQSTNAPQDKRLTLFKLGHCCVKAGDYRRAILILGEDLFGKNEFGYFFYARFYWLGLAHLFVNETSEAITCLRQIVDARSDDELPSMYFGAVVNLGFAYFTDFDKYHGEIIRLASLLTDHQELVHKQERDGDNAGAYISAAFVLSARAKKRLARIAEAVGDLRSALALADERSKLGLLAEAVEMESEKGKKIAFLREAVEFSAKNNISLREENKERPFDLTVVLYAKLLEYSASLQAEAEWQQLLARLLEDPFENGLGAWNVLQLGAFTSISKGQHKLASRFLRECLALPLHKAVADERRNLFTVGLIFTPYEESLRLWTEYQSEYLSGDDAILIESDFRLIYGIVVGRLSKNELEEAAAVVHMARRRQNLSVPTQEPTNGQEKLNGGLLILDYLETQILFQRGDLAAALNLAKGLVSRLQFHKSKPPLYFSEDLFRSFRQRLLQQIGLHQKSDPVLRADMRIGRNEKVFVKYGDGTQKVGKYKLFIEDLRLGKCTFVNRVDPHILKR